MIELEKIRRIEQLRREELKIRAEQSKIGADVPFSLDALKVVYSVTRANAATYSFSESKVREYFLFVSLYMFDPSSIVRKMKKGLRENMARMLGVSENNVSHLTKDILFRYTHYRNFRDDCDRIHSESIELIKTLRYD